MCFVLYHTDPQIPLNQRCTGNANLGYNECEDPNAECKIARDRALRCLCEPNFYEERSSGQCGTVTHFRNRPCFSVARNIKLLKHQRKQLLLLLLLLFLLLDASGYQEACVVRFGTPTERIIYFDCEIISKLKLQSPEGCWMCPACQETFAYNRGRSVLLKKTCVSARMGTIPGMVIVVSCEWVFR